MTTSNRPRRGLASDAADYWENRYRDSGRIWSGRPNAALEREVGGMPPGTALDLGSGEGGDALWLARNGWSVTAVDIAPSALAVGTAAQSAEDDITWIAADLAEWEPPARYDLVSSCFLHSTVDLPREAIHRRAARAVAPGGVLLIVGHVGVPSWSIPEESAHQHSAPDLPTPDAVLAALFTDDPALSPSDWTVLTNATVERLAIAPDGSSHRVSDGVLKLRRH